MCDVLPFKKNCETKIYKKNYRASIFLGSLIVVLVDPHVEQLLFLKRQSIGSSMNVGWDHNSLAGTV